MPEKSKNRQTVVIVLALAGALVFAIFLPEDPRERAAREKLEETIQRLEAQREGRPIPKHTSITLANYHRIQEGMSYNQVARILDLHGEELSRSSIADHTTVMYARKNRNGSNMNAMFQNDKLVSKAQFGLE